MKEGLYVALVVILILMLGNRVKNSGQLTEAQIYLNMLPGGTVIDRSKAIAAGIEQLKSRTKTNVTVVSILKIDTETAPRIATHSVYAMLYYNSHMHNEQNPIPNKQNPMQKKIQFTTTAISYEIDKPYAK